MDELAIADDSVSEICDFVCGGLRRQLDRAEGTLEVARS